VKTVWTLALTLLAALPTQAQQRLRVPAEAEVVIPPRGAGPMPQPPGLTRRPADEAWPDEPGLSGWGYALVPLAAGALAALATTLPGGRSVVGGATGGSGAALGGSPLPAGGAPAATTSGPVRTR
jgi:hypothetical protein